jgi:hypothetical protein
MAQLESATIMDTSYFSSSSSLMEIVAQLLLTGKAAVLEGVDSSRLQIVASWSVSRIQTEYKQHAHRAEAFQKLGTGA